MNVGIWLKDAEEEVLVKLTGESPIVCEDDTKPAKKKKNKPPPHKTRQPRHDTLETPLGPLLPCEHRSTDTSEELSCTIVISDWSAMCAVPFDSHILCL